MQEQNGFESMGQCVLFDCGHGMFTDHADGDRWLRHRFLMHETGGTFAPGSAGLHSMRALI
jgi:hypothetical protein